MVYASKRNRGTLPFSYGVNYYIYLAKNIIERVEHYVLHFCIRLWMKIGFGGFGYKWDFSHASSKNQRYVFISHYFTWNIFRCKCWTLLSMQCIGKYIYYMKASEMNGNHLLQQNDERFIQCIKSVRFTLRQKSSNQIGKLLKTVQSKRFEWMNEWNGWAHRGICIFMWSEYVNRVVAYWIHYWFSILPRMVLFLPIW